MKVVFLDIDGVLNNFKDRNFGETFSVPACQNFQKLLDEMPDLRVVVSSAWRTWGLDYVKEILQKNGIDSSKVIDITGNEAGNRGAQIQAWLDRNPEVTAFVIIDDETDMGPLKNKLVKTNSYIGLTAEDVRLAKQILDNQK